jgi:replicative DNA helicase
MFPETITAGKLIPQNVEAEQAVLGAMLMDQNAVFSAIEYLKEDDFYKFSHKTIYSCVVDLCEKNEPIDLITVNDWLLKKDLLEKVGGTSYITELLSSVPTSANILQHAKIVREKSILRNIITSLTEVITFCYDNEDEADTLLDMAEAKIFDISTKRETNSVIHIKDEIQNSFANLEKLYQQKGMLTGVPSGFRD